nr:hypothetical protein Iba_chr14aCG4940 [Ipomoea batatas]
MASQNPFTTFFTSEDRLTLARKIVQGISDFNPAACAKIALTFALNPSLMDYLTMKYSRRIMELAKHCSESAPPTQALAEPRTTAAAHDAASDVAPRSAVTTADASATNVAQPHVIPPLPRAVIELDSSAIHAASTPTTTDVAQRTATPLLPQAAPPPREPAALPHTHEAAATQPDVHGVHSAAASSDLLFIAPPGSSVSQVDASKISSTKIGVSSVLFSDKMVLSSGSLNYQSASDLASSEKLVSDVIKSHDVSLVAKLPTSDLSLDSISVSIPENQSVPIVSVPLSALDQCNPVASRTRKSKAKLANCVIPVAPSVKRKLIMDSVSDVEPPRKSQKSMEKVLLEDKKMLQSFETDDEDLDSAPAR